ncbi:MAG TPA: TonB-dependent receptor [Opitutaceae bacterium]|nr:TonB-dependent receptor [Opitutaceae bacterium]
MSALRPILLFATAAASTAAGADLADLDITELVQVRVSPFEVSTTLDRGYRASNSVSGSRLDVAIGQLPFAIQAFTEDFIEDQRPADLFDIARYSPGVTYRSNDFNEGNANLAIRGFAVSTAPGGVQVLRDGFHGPSVFDFTNISRVEVVKGPASFLYGQVAPGGIVNVITKKPQTEAAARFRATYGSYGEYRAELDTTGPIAPRLFYRFAASYGHDMHYWDPYEAHSWDLAPSLLWQPNDRVSVSAKYEHYRKIESPQLMQKPGYGIQAGIVPTAADPNRSGVDVPGLPADWNSMSDFDYRDSETDVFNAWGDLKLDDHWNVRAGYSHLDYEIDAVFSGNLGMANNSTFLQGRRVRRQTYRNADDTTELQAVGRYELGSVTLRTILGAQYVRRHFSAEAGQAPNDPTLGSTPTASPLPLWDLRDPSTWNRSVTVPLPLLTTQRASNRLTGDDTSGFGGVTLGFMGDRLLTLAGVRGTRTEVRYVNYLDPLLDFETSTDALTPQYGLLFRATPELAVYASYAESFVPGSVLLNNVDGTHRAPEPTEGRGYDIGLKANLFGGRLSSTLTVFDVRNRNIITDLAVTDSAGVVVVSNVQSGEQRARGAECDVTVALTPDWQLYASYSYLYARITEFTGNDAEILARDPATLAGADRANYKNAFRYHNAPLQMSAPHLANLWTRYNFASGPLKGFHVGGGVNCVWNQTLLPDTPDSAHQSYTLVNLALGYSGRWRGATFGIELVAKNLTDEVYRPSQSTRCRPREILLSVSTKF